MAPPRFILAAVVAFGVVLATALCGCASPAEPGVFREARPKIGYVVTNMTFHFAREMSGGFRAGARIVGGVEATTVGPRTTDPTRQVELFKELTNTAKSGVAVSASARAVFARPLAEAAARGVPLAVSAGRPLPGTGVKLFVENDNYELGRMLADQAIKRLPPNVGGKIVLGTDIPAHPALDKRAMGMRDEFAKRLPGVRVVGPFDTQRDQRTNLMAWRLLVEANPDAMAFLGTGDIDAFNLAEVRTDTKGTWLAGGFSVEPHVLQRVKDGRLFAVVSPEHFLKGAITGRLLAEHAKYGRPLPEGWLVTPGLAITASNVDQVVQRQSSEVHKLAWIRPQLDRLTSQNSHLRPLDQAE